MIVSVILSAALLLTANASVILPYAHASGAIFTIASSQGPPFYDAFQVINRYGDVFNVTNSASGDSAGQISTSNNGYPFLQLWYFKHFVYNPSSLTDVHLFINYWVNAYVYAAPYCTSAWLEGEYGVADGSVNTSTGLFNYAIPMTDFEYDQAITTGGGIGCSTSPSINSVNQGKIWNNDLLQSDCSPNPSFCNFAIGQTYTFELMFEITANPGAYIQNTQGTGPAYLYTGMYGSNNDFTNQNFCIILSYQSSPVTGCPLPLTGGGGGGGVGGGGGGGRGCPCKL